MKNYTVHILGCNIWGYLKFWRHVIETAWWLINVRSHNVRINLMNLWMVHLWLTFYQPYLIVFMLGRSARHVPGWDSRSGFQVGKELLLLPLQERLMSEDTVNRLLTLIFICYLMWHASFHSTPSLDGWQCVFNTKQILDQR